jgi:hypothetical protein
MALPGSGGARSGRGSRLANWMQKMARPEGFEPPTNGFGSHYSIRLSYGRMVENRATAGIAGGAF